MSLIFKKIKNAEVFTSDFAHMTINNEISFPRSEKICVLYGPNGTGKTSLSKVLSGAPETELEFELDGTNYTSDSGLFHVVSDQNNRNIISGETRDFFLGDNIRHEFELQDKLAENREEFLAAVIAILNANGIKASKSPLLDLISNSDLRELLKDCANPKQKGRKFPDEKIVLTMNTVAECTIEEYDEAKLAFLVEDLTKKKPVITQIEQLANMELLPNHQVREIEENTEAISILNRFHKDQCIVCDTCNIDWEELLKSKTSNRDTIKKKLTPEIKSLLDEITSLTFTSDPFDLKQRLLRTLEEADMSIVTQIIDEIKKYKTIFSAKLQNSVAECYSRANIEDVFHEYKEIVSKAPEITQEDYLYIQEIVANSMNKPLTVERDENKRIRIKLSERDFLGVSRDELPLSNGEQNFLSLTFEFLKAKNSTAPIVVIDDPVSSFDSIYKNKVVYAIVKILHQKQRIILTHNTDLIRLLDGQYKKCFKLYLLNNTDGEINGFIPLRNREQDMLISLEKLLEALRTDVPKNVRNMELFLISMIPFIRGYANIVNRKDIYEDLTQVMHGYKTGNSDIAKAYIELFGNPDGRIPNSYIVNVSDIFAKSIDGAMIVDTAVFPLLNRTLRHSFQYLVLRLLVEKALVEKRTVDTNKNTQLGQIISAAFPDDNNIEDIRARIKLTSKKTLINEFNHFEGNLSIFQPAIDITDQALHNEKEDLIKFIEELA